MSEIVTVDVGGTHTRFALAEVAEGRVHALGDACTFETGAQDDLATAWTAFRERIGRSLPPAAAIAFAGTIGGEVLTLTNNRWEMRPARLPDQLEVERLTVVNDFAAVAHAAAQLGDSHFRALCGPQRDHSADGVISIVGPGTGLGVAQLFRRAGAYEVVATEGGHVDFAPLDAFEDRMLAHLRQSHGRVSVERVLGGAGLAAIHQVLAADEAKAVGDVDEREIWERALSGTDGLESAALDRYCLSLGAVAGDLALAHGAKGVVIAGGLGLRLAAHLPRSGFARRFVDKGRFEQRMRDTTVKLLVHPQPGLYGAAAAFAREHR